MLTMNGYDLAMVRPCGCVTSIMYEDVGQELWDEFHYEAAELGLTVVRMTTEEATRALQRRCGECA